MAWLKQVTPYPGNARGQGWSEHDDDNPGIVYLGGGRELSTLTQQTWRFNTVGDVWTQMADMPQTVGYLSRSVKVGRSIYVQGGEGTSGGGGGRNGTWRYDIDSNTWATLANFPFLSRSGAIAHFNGMIYAFGGIVMSGSDSLPSLLLHRYEIATNTWTPLALELPAAESTAGLSAVAFGTRILVGPVYDPADEPYNTAGSGMRRFLWFTPSAPTSWEEYGGKLEIDPADVGGAGAESRSGLAFPRLTVHGSAIYLHGGDLTWDTLAGGASSTHNKFTLTTQPDSDTRWVDNLVRWPSEATNKPTTGGMLNGSAGRLYGIGAINNTSDQVWEDSVAVPIVAGADLRVIRDTGEFRYTYRWPTLIDQWGGTDEGWDKVEAAGYTYDEATGVFSHG